MKRHRSAFAWRALLPVGLLLSACGGGAEPADEPSLEERLATALVGLGLPVDYAEFFAAAQLTVSCTSELACTILRTYPNGATRQIDLTATADQLYTPTDVELAGAASAAYPVYDGRFSASAIEESTPPVDTQVDLGYFVPSTSAAGAARQALTSADQGSTPLAGFQFDWKESGKKGADVGIGSLLEHFKDLGKVVESTGSIYAVASALSDISGAMEISRQVNGWLAELAELERCASDPTNPITQSDPTYSATAVANVQRVRTELKELSAVRFLNVIDETACGLHLVSAVLSIPLKQAMVWTETTLKNLSEQLMHDARSSVVSCEPSCPTSFAATGISNSEISLSWSSASVGSVVTTYTLTGGNTQGTATTATAWVDTGLERSTTYCYTVSVTNDYGTAEDCPQACGTTLGPPRVVSTGPGNGATGVSVNAVVTASFSEELDVATVNGSTFSLSGPGGAVGGAVSGSGSSATLTPSGALAHSTTYTATLTTGIEDVEGVAMEASYTWSFTTESSPVAGNLQFSLDLSGSIVSSGSAAVTWTKFEDLGDVRRYVPSGTLTAEVWITDCDPLTTTVPLQATVPGGPGPTLVVYTATNVAYPNSYQFGLSGDPNTMMVFTCGVDPNRYTVSVPASLINFLVGTCPSGPGLVPFTDEAELVGTYSCLEAGLVSAAWDFSM